MNRKLLTGILLAVAYLSLGYVLSILNFDIFIGMSFGIILGLVLTRVVFGIVDYVYPVPAALNAKDVKSFLLSKIFWSCFLPLIFTIAKGLFNIEIKEGTAQQILELDWGNLFIAGSLTLGILFRKTDISKRII